MWTESGEIKSALTELNLNWITLAPLEAAEVTNKVVARFTEGGKYSYPLWEHLNAFTGVVKEFAWEWFEQLLNDKQVVLFFEKDDDKTVFFLKDGSEIVKVMNNSTRMTFYVSNLDADFLYAYHSDHSIFRVCGSARVGFKEFVKKSKLDEQLTDWH